MQQVFGARLWGWPWGWATALAFLTLGASLIHVRFWCRYLCPLGALLALSNKVALAPRFAPPRRFGHCDLGVRGEFDLDCIRCNRCLGGRDTRASHEPQPGV
jgi:polyferredoxin